mmetsp:Transcript_4159/g.4785  ORF Transcript_4159/g.4785 Transcript_4159/m.4785 type:complete len:322 (-) Transcript_4159:447-1412(-)|eukprot:CAMPEP_0197855314 /NCGR_PEP_ID=MMETSP1438-20131217/26385_1 /TAXON_ID=1461541 /ORGANISM="Pterosperma sp., Strain CCMP1384" /LENGTH=321 /DNA_ID=CAMNT_0043470375 /DNA_START=178 /DNA_END=1143 /DNA_ORIENTATION=+
MTVEAPVEAAEALKEQGNLLYKNKDFLKAAATYTKAIKLDGQNPVYYSNRSGAFFMLNKVSKAISDADMAIKLKPTWDKGYFRKGCALEAAEKWEEALDAYRQAAENNPKNTEVRDKIARLTKYLKTISRIQGNKKGAGEVIRSDSDYTSAIENLEQGADIPYDKERVEAWAKECLYNAINEWIAGDMAPTAHFLAGKKDADGHGTAQAQVAIKDAFKSPELLENCCGFLRKYSTDMHFHAVCCVVAKSDITFPSVWEKAGKNGWPCGKDGGFFVQVESRDVQRLWFVPHSDKDVQRGRAIPKDPVSLDVENFRLLPPIVD